MKYAVINQRGGINRISPNAITGNPEGTTVAELTDEQATQVTEGRTSTPPVRYALHEGVFMTMAEKRAITNPPPPAPLPTRLKAILAAQPAAVRAAFLPITAGVNYALSNGDNEAALAAITATPVPAELEPAKAALIAEFE